MNGAQFDAKRDRDRALADVGLKQHELKCARRRYRVSQNKLREAVSADPESWYGSPGLKLKEGEVVP